MNQNRKLMKIFFITFYLIGSLFVNNYAHAEIDVIPEISGNGPNLEGNITSSEWAEAVKFAVDFNNQQNDEEATIFVQTNGSHIFVGFNYTSTQEFVPVNETFAQYNNVTHNWLALQIDNNLDGSELGSVTSPDDVIVVDQYNTTTYDGIANGNSTMPFTPDTSVNGTEDAIGIRTNYTDGPTINAGYEFVKALQGSDKNGSDFNLVQSKIMQFKLVYWMNQTGNATLTQGKSTSWFNVLINETGTGLAVKTSYELNMQIVVNDDDRSDYSALELILDAYGYNKTTVTGTNFTADESTDLIILILSENSVFPESAQESLEYYLKLGGKAMIFLSSEFSSSSRLANMFNLNYLPNSVLIPGEEVNSTIQSFPAVFDTKFNFIEGESLVTNQSVSTIEHTGGGFNITGLNDKSENQYTLSQEYYGYNMLKSSDAIYDSNNNDDIDNDETGNGLSLGVAFDFVKGGRVTVFPSNTIIKNDHIINNHNIPMILKLIPWNTGIIDKVNIESTTTNRNNFVVGESITINLNLTDVFGDVLANNQEVNLTIQLIQAGQAFRSISVSFNGPYHSETITVNKAGFIEIRTVSFIYGFGFGEGERLHIHADNDLPPLNDLSLINFIMFTVFFVSAVLAVFVFLRSKK